MESFKIVMCATVLFVLIILIGYAMGLLDKEEYVQAHLGEYLFKQYDVPKSGGTCRSYCVIDNKEMYEMQVSFKKLEVNN